MGVSVYWPLSVLCVYVFVMSNQSTSKKHIMCQTSVNLKPCCIKHHIKILLVPRYQGLLCVDPYYSKIAHQMRRNHPFSQRNRITEKNSWGGGWRWQGSGTEVIGQNLKKEGGKQYRGVFILHKTNPPLPPNSWLSPIPSKNTPIRAIFEKSHPPPFMKGGSDYVKVVWISTAYPRHNKISLYWVWK